MGALKTRKHVRFWLNDKLVELGDLSPTQNLLDFLRLQSGLRGTKEGCAEGDCGACTVLVGRLSGDDLVYEAVNACIRFTASLDGCHVVSIEHLRGEGGKLHPVQEAMVALHGSQCGFCSPGIVMSLYALWMSQPNADQKTVERVLQGNLCRCTGYVPIVKAARRALENGGQSADPLVNERTQMLEKLFALHDGARVEINSEAGRFILPANVDDLAQIFLDKPDATLVAGATDVGLWVTKFMRDLGTVVFTGHLGELHTIVEGGEGVRLGA
ncbi:MAG: 2Fe-2S iron-sulfur cluster-binding protein, partial [Devosiaceae bacterium]|nr:2Fe-2S iron-sulfur cluster-binding protein [Devosiaceae bacterium]